MEVALIFGLSVSSRLYSYLCSTMVKSSKRGSKSTKLAAAKDGITKVSAEGKIIDKGKGKGKVTVNVSDELRQAVMDLGGNEEDLELIAGVDSDDEVDEPVSGAASASKGQGKSDEVSEIFVDGHLDVLV